MSEKEKKILIVDDAAFMRQVLKDIIKANGLAISTLEAGDGFNAVKLYKTHRPSLVTMDINMPGADGIQTLRAIKKFDPSAKIIIITSFEQKQLVQNAFRLGAREYVVKPFDRSQVGLVINKVLRQK